VAPGGASSYAKLVALKLEQIVRMRSCAICPPAYTHMTLQTMARAEPPNALPAMLNNSPHGTEATVLTLRIARLGTS
jgi:hypothetical protein